MNIKLLDKQIKAAINGQDQLVFVYRKTDADRVVRFVTPLEIVANAQVDQDVGDSAIKVLCAQHLPQEGYRYFFMNKIDAFHRVMTRDPFANSSFFKDKDGDHDSSEVS